MSKTHTLAKSALMLTLALGLSGLAQAGGPGNIGTLRNAVPMKAPGNIGTLAGLSGNTGTLRNAAPTKAPGNIGTL